MSALGTGACALGLLLVVGCAGSEKRQEDVVSEDPIVRELEGSWLVGIAGEHEARGRQVLAELVADWHREADASPAEAKAILEILRADLETLGKGRAPVERLDILEASLLDRRVSRVSVDAFALGKAVVDGRLGPDESKRQGEAILARLAPLKTAVENIHDPEWQRRLRRDLGESMLDALYAIERKAMSLRLGHYKGP